MRNWVFTARRSNRPGQNGSRARFHSALKPPPDLVVIQQLWLVLQHDPIQNLDHGVEAECFDAAFVITHRTATFLGRAITLAADAGRVALAGLQLKLGFDPDLVLPIVRHVVFIDELVAAAEIELQSVRSGVSAPSSQEP